MAIRRLHTWVAVLGIAVTGAAAWWWQQQPRRAPNDASSETRASAGAATTNGATRQAGGASAAGAGSGAGPAAVEVGRVETIRIEEDAQALGTLRAAQTVILRPEVSGRIVRLGFQDGQRVRRGQLMVQLDDQLQRAQLQQAEAQSAIARTNLQRSRDLLAQGFVSQSAVDQNVAALEVADAQVALARAQLVRLQIVAPFDGVTGIRSVSVGDYLKDGADIVSLEDRSYLWVDFRLPERFVGAARPGLAVSFTLDSMPGQPFTGKVEALDSLVDANGRSLLVRARIDRPSAELKSGMFARARIVFAVRERAVVVPEEALVPQGGKQFIVKLVDGGNGAKLSQRLEARIGSRVPGKVEILGGLAAGDIVVTAGQPRLMSADGLAVRVIELKGPAGSVPSRPATGSSGAASTPAVRAGLPA